MYCEVSGLRARQFQTATYIADMKYAKVFSYWKPQIYGGHFRLFKWRGECGIARTMRVILHPPAGVDCIRSVVSSAAAAAWTSSSALTQCREPALISKTSWQRTFRKSNEMPKDYLTEYEPLLTKGSKKPKRLQVSRL